MTTQIVLAPIASSSALIRLRPPPGSRPFGCGRPCSTGVVQTIPSPDSLPLLAASTIAATTSSARSSSTTKTRRAFGRNRDSKTRPRYSWISPRCRPWPTASITVTPTWPASFSTASMTVSTRSRMTIASTFVTRATSCSPTQKAPGGLTPGASSPRSAPAAAPGIRLAPGPDGRSAASAGVAKGRRDPGDRAEQRPRRRLVAAAIATQELDLDRVHRIDVRVAKADRPLENRLALEELRAPDDLEHERRSSARAPRRSRRRDGRAPARPGRARGSPRRSRGSTSRASSRGCRGASGRTPTPGRGAAAPRAVSPLGVTREGRSAAVPGGQKRAVLRPGEDPRNRSQRAQVALVVGPPGRPGAEREERELVDRREGAEERRRSRRPPRRGRDTPRGPQPESRVEELTRIRPVARRLRPRGTRRGAWPRAPPRGSGRRAPAGRT